MNIQKLFKPYIVRRANGQCQVLIPLIELDALCDRIEDIKNTQLSNLLAYIHRDGGHYEHANGTKKAVEDAIIKVCNWIPL